jgi:hypothetical protein
MEHLPGGMYTSICAASNDRPGLYPDKSRYRIFDFSLHSSLIRLFRPTGVVGAVIRKIYPQTTKPALWVESGFNHERVGIEANDKLISY